MRQLIGVVMSKLLKILTICLYMLLIAGLVFTCLGLAGFTASFYFDLDRELYRKIVSLGVDTFIPAMVLIMWNER